MFSWNGPLPEPDIRRAEDLLPVLYNEHCRARGPAYYMYRDLARTGKDREWLCTHHLRYDVTVIPPGVICGENVKTKGHYHPKNPSGTPYPEVYEVLEGKAEYLLQSTNPLDAVSVSAEKGAIMLIPPGYGHVTINSADSTLVMANIVSTEFSSLYREFEELRGAIYYRMQDGRYLANPRYSEIPPLRQRNGCNLSRFPYLSGASLYSLIGNEAALEFLNRPETSEFCGVLGD